MEDNLCQRCQEYAVHVAGMSDIGCHVLDMAHRRFSADRPMNRFCAGCCRCEEMNTHMYGCSEAYRWNGKYIYYCPLGLVFVASSVSDDTGALAGGLIAGPLVMGELPDTLEEVTDPILREAVAALPVLSTARVNHLAELLAAITGYIAGLPHSRAGSFVYEQEKMLNTIYTIRDQQTEDESAANYPISYEKQLHDLICSRDKNGAQELLNELLGHVYCASNFHLETIKTRVVELVVLLSRATIDAGADIREIFLFNTNYIHEIEQFTSLEELSVWLTGIMHRFINYSFDFTQVKHSDVVHKVMDYVKANYSKKISLDDVARHVYLSRSYLSSIFKEETGDSLFAYINRVRIDKSKMLLLDSAVNLVDVASLCGFDDQSYFTKVFKKATGVSPKKYRDTRGKGTF